MKGITEMYTLVFEENEIVQIDQYLYGNMSPESWFDFMGRRGMSYKESIALLTFLDKVHDAAEKIRTENLRRIGE